MWHVGSGVRIENQATQVGKLINEFKELRDVIGNSGCCGVLLFQLLFENLADAFQALIQSLIVRPQPRFRLLHLLLQQENRVSHLEVVNYDHNKAIARQDLIISVY